MELSLRGAETSNPLAVALDVRAATFHPVDDVDEVIGVGSGEQNIALRDERGDHVGARLDAVGNDGVLRAAEALDALDFDAARAVPHDFRAHLVEKIRQVAHFGLAGGALDGRRALRPCRGHHDVVRAEDGRTKFAAQEYFLADEIRLGDVHVAARAVRDRAQFGQSPQMNIDGPVADGTAARLGNRGLPATRDHWSEDADGGAHFSHQIVRDFGNHLFRAGRHGAVVERHLRPEPAHDFEHEPDVGQVGHVVDDARFRSQKSRRQDRQGRVLRAADFNAALEAGAAFYDEFIHD